MNWTVPDSGFPLASIDIGSHTIRLLAATIEAGQRIFPIATQRRVTRLARGFHLDANLRDQEIRESLSVLVEYSGILETLGIHSVSCGATGVIRRAQNGADFLKTIEEFTGLQVSILSESWEAYLSAKGSLTALPSRSGLILSFDLGGSSTEFFLVDAEANEPIWSTSVFMGAATITENHLAGNPPTGEALPTARAAARRLLKPVVSSLAPFILQLGSPPATLQLVGTAGTVSTLAAMFLGMRVYEPHRVNGLVLSRQWVDETVDLLAGMPLALRRNLPGLEEGREDIILGGALIVQEILESLHQERFTVTDGGLLEGLLLDLAEKELGWPRRLFSPLTWEMRKG